MASGYPDPKNLMPNTALKTPISVLIPVRNELYNVEDCLRSVAWVDDVVVVDSASTDGTTERARQLGARVVQFRYVPGGLKKKNWALRNVEFRHEWILILDADERIPSSLAQEIDSTVRSDGGRHAGFYISRRFYFLGRWIRHAGYFPSWNLRLLRRGFGEYEFIPDTAADAGDNEVHEHILLRGPAGSLREPMDHYAYPSIQAFVEKHNRYSSWEARCGRRYLEMPRDNGGTSWHLAARRLAKRLARYMPFPDILRFFYHYVLKLGFLDGTAGYILCRLLAQYEFLIWGKTFESRRRLRENSAA